MEEKMEEKMVTLEEALENEPEAEEILADEVVENAEGGEEVPAEEIVDGGVDEFEALEEKKRLIKEEIESLEGELERKRAEADKKAKEYAEFKELYPEADPELLDGEVLELVEQGVPLAAAYALYEKRLSTKSRAAKAHNDRTKASGFGGVGNIGESEYFTPDEVRAMTQHEVRQNYQKILRSMKCWH